MLSRNTILPLIASQMLIDSGIDTEKKSIGTINQMLNLLNNVISQDQQKAQ